MNKNYVDVTKEWLKKNNINNYKIKDMNYFEYENIKYIVDGKNVVLDYSKKEKEVAEWLVKNFGGLIFMCPRVNSPDNISTPDYFWNGEKWDLKCINGYGKRAIEDAIKNKNRQACNFIFDITDSKIEYNNLQNQLQKIYKSKTTDFVDKIVCKKGNDVIFIYKRIKKR